MDPARARRIRGGVIELTNTSFLCSCDVPQSFLCPRVGLNSYSCLVSVGITWWKWFVSLWALNIIVWCCLCTKDIHGAHPLNSLFDSGACGHSHVFLNFSLP